jgi:hypothetical protein
MITDPRTAAPPPPTYVGYSIACTEEYRGWLRALSARTLIPASVIVREALKQWAVTRGHAAPPPR